MDNQSPVFLVGAERSGTTLLRLMLDHHPDICFLSEHEFIVDYFTKDGSFPDSKDFYSFLKNDWLIKQHGYELKPNLSFQELVIDCLKQGWGESNAKVFGATVHRHFDRLIKLWPDAKFIHIIRDPRDVTDSVMKMGWAAHPWYAVDRWLEAEELWEEFKPQLSEEQFLCVKYEDLLKENKTTLDKICSFLGLSFHQDMLSYPQYSTYSAVRPEYSQKWKIKAKERDIQLVEHKSKGLLKARGYDLSSLPQIEVNPIKKVGYRIQNRIGLFLFNCERLGWPLAVSGAINRRLPEKIRVKLINDRIEAIQKTYIK